MTPGTGKRCPAPPLTEEELAAIERTFGPDRIVTADQAKREVPRLIADLRASRAEVERLREALRYETMGRQ